ncbi:MAG: GIY-YIG nuclease family protein [Vicingus serpentipes]|nr:GIY-YIG nuclease family protein [Vicingus serpentipes]
MKTFYTYILASKRNGTLYIGLTNELERRIFEHKNNVGSSFTSKYKIHQLVYFEEHATYEQAFTRERQMKKWKRDWKIELIEKENPLWKDLSSDWYE